MVEVRKKCLLISRCLNFMTYCVAVKVKSGLVFLSDSRTNAGVDDISTTRKMSIFSKPGDRSLIVLSAGSILISISS